MKRCNPLWACVSALLFLSVASATCQDGWPPAPRLSVSRSAEGAESGDAGKMPQSISAKPADSGGWECVFRYSAQGGCKSVALAGSFNEWRRDALPLRRGESSDEWMVSVRLAEGTYQYKFVVDGEKWLADPENPDVADDNHGGKNSVLKLGRTATLTESPTRVGDGRIDAAGFEHRPELPLYFQVLSADRILIRYRTFARDLERVEVAVRDGPTVELATVETGSIFTLWEAEVELGKKAAGALGGGTVRIEYTFILTDGALRIADPKTYTASFDQTGIFRTPEWAKNAVWYQILVERFRNGDAKNDPDVVRRWTSEWFAPSPSEVDSGQSFYRYFVFGRMYGGDIQGLEEKLGYLKELGVNALYLNPVFKANSHHKYDTIDYVHIDDHYGVKGDYEAAAAKEKLQDPSTWMWTESDKVFLRFLKKAHAMGFKVILDGVFNHVGSLHRAFLDVKRNGEKSAYADWFDVTSWEPFRYTGWAGVDSLPIFRKDAAQGIASRSAREHIFAVTRRWMDPDGDGDPSDGIDGWRLDVPNEVPERFWTEWRRLVKSINPEAYISGEIWDRADQWLDDRHFDAVMNYQFARVAVEWILNRQKKITPTEADRKLRELRLAYPQAATYAMQNLVDSHDTDRLASMALNPDRGYDQENRVQDNGPNYDNAKPSAEDYKRARLVALLQMTYVGSPMIYYGDEVGMWGADDPTNRKPMVWKDLEPYEKPGENFVMDEQLEFYRAVIALRAAHAALRTGSFQTLLSDDAADVWAFMRRADRDLVLVVLNASNEARTVRIGLGADASEHWKYVFGGQGIRSASQGTLEVTAPPIAGCVLAGTWKE